MSRVSRNNASSPFHPIALRWGFSLLTPRFIPLPVRRSLPPPPPEYPPHLPPKNPHHFALLDPLRGLASLLVVLHHLPGQPMGRWAGEVGVMLFFVISGYCIAAAWHRALQRAMLDPTVPPTRVVGTFFLRRVRRIFPPWWAALVLWVVFAGLERALAISPGVWSLNALLLHWVHLPTHPTPMGVASANPIAILGIAWTLCYEEQFYILVTLLLGLALALTRWLHHATLRVVGLVALALLVGSLAWVVALPHRATGLLPDYLCHFGLGVLLHAALCVLQGSARKAALIALVLACAVALGAHTLRYPDVPLLADSVRRVRHVSRELVVASAAALLLLALRPLDGRWLALSSHTLRPVRWCARCLAFLGSISYSLYLTHTIPAERVQHHASMLAAHLGLTGPAHTALLTTLHLASQLLLAGLFWWLVERHFVGSTAPRAPTAPRSP